MEKRTFSCFSGYSFTFDLEGNEVVAWFSMISGREKVFVNGTLLASQSNYNFKSKNIIEINGKKYRIELTISSVIKGPIVCTLYHENTSLKRQHLEFSKTNLFRMMVYFLIGVVATKWSLSMSSNVGWPVWAFLIPLFLGLIWFVPWDSTIAEEDNAGT